jgi:transposase
LPGQYALLTVRQPNRRRYCNTNNISTRLQGRTPNLLRCRSPTGSKAFSQESAPATSRRRGPFGNVRYPPQAEAWCRDQAADRRCPEDHTRSVAEVFASGIEGTHAQAISRCGLRRCRYIGLAKTRLQHVITAAAVNLVRIADWYGGIPAATTRCSRFAALQMAA